MQITLEARGDSCVLSQTTPSSSVVFEVPATKKDLLAAIVAIMSDPEMKEHNIDGIMLVKNQTEVKIHAGVGSFNIPHTHVFSLMV